MPWSQMMRMNMRPPRLMAARKLAKMPAVKARILNRLSVNMGSRTRTSMMQKAARRTTPRASEMTTRGLVQPMAWPP